ncbi:MAG TPA: zinc ribbon domain-containing protein [Methanofastidiosum sp.]|nr:zinc ribbon domain-containing protein [Methanofastidiosum sp.]HPA49336.1 zinc ribbon domain-containing protein [Methanofastidiosum sp.]HQQ49420.1 zinc ribbon domain-containing protein [Methanofastidiosum sp.]
MPLSICAKCGREMPSEGYKNCPYCGSEVQEQKRLCNKCGRELSKNSNLCEKCGPNLEENKPKSKLKFIGALGIIAVLFFGIVFFNVLQNLESSQIREEVKLSAIDKVKNEIPEDFKKSASFPDYRWHEKQIDGEKLVWYSLDDNECNIGGMWVVPENGVVCANQTAKGITDHLGCIEINSAIEIICPKEIAIDVNPAQGKFVSDFKEILAKNNIPFTDVRIVDDESGNILSVVYRSRQKTVDQIPLNEVASISLFFSDSIKMGLNVDRMVVSVQDGEGNPIGTWRCERLWAERYNKGIYAPKDLMNICYNTVKYTQ